MCKIKIDYVKVNELLKQGLSYVEIGKIMNVKSGSINCYMLKRNGKVVRGNKEVLLTQLQKEVIFGSLLGDGSCYYTSAGHGKYSKNPVFKEEHGMNQINYSQYKIDYLHNLISNKNPIIYNRYDKRFKNPNYQSNYFVTSANPALIPFREMFYINNKKIIPKDLSLLTPLALAIWYMDDGTKLVSGYKIYSNSFNRPDLERIIIYLKDSYNIIATVDSYNRLYIRSQSKKTFTELIKNFIIPSMEYKLHTI